MSITEPDVKPLNFALVGAGRIAHSYVEAFRNSKLARLVAITDTRFEAAASLAELLKVASFDDPEEMLANTDIDAVIIATPPSTHCELASLFLGRSIHVLCEKPVSIASDDARRMRHIGKTNGVVFTMASKFRYVEDVSRAKSIVTSGLLGDIVHYENTFTSFVDMSSRWNSVPSLSGGGVLIDNGSHSVDIMRYFLGPLKEIQVIEAARTQGLRVEETVHSMVRTGSGILGTFTLSWSISTYSDTYLAIYGSEGTLRVGWKESAFQQHGRNQWVKFGTGFDKVKAFGGQLNNFAAAVLGVETLLITADDAVASVDAIEAGYASMRSLQWAEIGEPARVAVAV